MAEAVTTPPAAPEIPPEPALTILPGLEEPAKPAAPEPYRHPFDIMASEEETSLLADLKTQGFTPPGVDIPPLEVEPETPPAATETPPAEIPPVVAAPETPPPAAPEIPPVVAAPETPPAETKKEVGKQWRLYRQEKKAREAAESKAAAAAKALEERKAAPPPVDPNIEPGDDGELPPIEDPITKLRQEMAELKDRQAKSDAQLAADRANAAQQQEIQKQESDFLITHPDYRDAMDHLVTSRREEYETMGLIDHGANHWLINQEDAVKRFAAEEGKDPENDDQLFEAARELSFRTLIQQDRQAIIRSCRAEGINVAERVYKLAQLRNFNGTKAAPPPAPELAALQEADAAKLRVKTAMQQMATTKSLSAVSPTKAVPETRQIKNREDVLEMTDKEIAFLDKTRPGWDKDIFQ